MSTKTDLLDLLSSNRGNYVSGQHVADTLGISRAAISKAISSLRKSGYRIQSKPGLGYILMDDADVLSKSVISDLITKPCKVMLFETIDSTNTYAKTLNPGHIGDPENPPVCVIADCQSEGRGRLGRSFASPSGSGIYLSLALKPDFEIDKALFITMAAAVATCRSLEKVCGISPKIKWVNDVFYNEKKICGILTEAQSNFETGTIDSIIIGIGINCFPGSFPEELSHIAGSVSDTPGSFSRSRLAACLVNELIDLIETFTNKEFLSEYRKRCFVLGKNIKVHRLATDTAVSARAIDIDDNGALIVEYLEGPHIHKMEPLTTGEISIRMD